MKKTVMIVDDEDDVRNSVKEVLGSAGYSLLMAKNGDECLKMISSGKKPDLILMDIMMPGTPVREVVAKVAPLKVAYLSVVRTTEAESEKLTKVKNVVGFIQKPFDIDELLANVQELFGTMTLQFLYSVDENNYLFDVRDLLVTILKTLNKVCFISLNKTGESVIEFCKINDINLDKVVIVDMISSRFKAVKNTDKIKYLSIDQANTTLGDIMKLIKKEGCEGFLVDSLSTLHIYYEEKQMLRFVHEMMLQAQEEHIISNLIIQKKDADSDWVKSLIPMVGHIREVDF